MCVVVVVVVLSIVVFIWLLLITDLRFCTVNRKPPVAPTKPLQKAAAAAAASPSDEVDKGREHLYHTIEWPTFRDFCSIYCMLGQYMLSSCVRPSVSNSLYLKDFESLKLVGRLQC